VGLLKLLLDYAEVMDDGVSSLRVTAEQRFVYQADSDLLGHGVPTIDARK
jgi:Txe/YoeB family toxin of Txe-Axe toxin-antitoxin module